MTWRTSAGCRWSSCRESCWAACRSWGRPCSPACWSRSSQWLESRGGSLDTSSQLWMDVDGSWNIKFLNEFYRWQFLSSSFTLDATCFAVNCWSWAFSRYFVEVDIELSEVLHGNVEVTVDILLHIGDIKWARRNRYEGCLSRVIPVILTLTVMWDTRDCNEWRHPGLWLVDYNTDHKSQWRRLWRPQKS